MSVLWVEEAEVHINGRKVCRAYFENPLAGRSCLNLPFLPASSRYQVGYERPGRLSISPASWGSEGSHITLPLLQLPQLLARSFEPRITSPQATMARMECRWQGPSHRGLAFALASSTFRRDRLVLTFYSTAKLSAPTFFNILSTYVSSMQTPRAYCPWLLRLMRVKEKAELLRTL